MNCVTDSYQSGHAAHTYTHVHRKWGLTVLTISFYDKIQNCNNDNNKYYRCSFSQLAYFLSVNPFHHMFILFVRRLLRHTYSLHSNTQSHFVNTHTHIYNKKLINAHHRTGFLPPDRTYFTQYIHGGAVSCMHVTPIFANGISIFSRCSNDDKEKH